MINQKILDFEDEVKTIGDTLTDSTISFYQSIVAKFLPTPSRIHYLFNLRDISKVKFHFIFPVLSHICQILSIDPLIFI